MHDSPNDRNAQQERRKYATRAWWASLLTGQESLGETFWVGNILSALVAFPVIVLVAVIPGLSLVVSALLTLYGAYLVELAFALYRTRPASGQSRWKAPAIIVTGLFAFGALVLAFRVL